MPSCGMCSQLCLHALADQLVQALAENIRASTACRGRLKVRQQAFDKLLPLLLTADGGRKLGVDVGAHDVQAGGAGRQPHAVLPALPDDFGFFQCQFINARHDDAVARGLDLVKGGFDLVIGALGPGQADDAGQKACLVHDVQPGLFTEDLIEISGATAAVMLTLPLAKSMPVRLRR